MGLGGGGEVPILFLWSDICHVFIGYRASTAEIPLLRGGVSHLHFACFSRGKTFRKGGRGYRTQLAMLRHQKPHSAQYGGIAEIVSR